MSELHLFTFVYLAKVFIYFFNFKIIIISLQHRCFQCKIYAKDTTLAKCALPSCGKYYHTTCVLWQKREDNQKVVKVCPLHHCHKCGISDFVGNSLTQCFRCPTAYHRSNCCPQDIHVLHPTIMTCIKHIQVYTI